MTLSPRRIVTGLDSAGRSTILFDAPVEGLDGPGGGPGGGLALVWRSAAVPASNAGGDDAAANQGSLSELANAPGTNFTVFRIPPSDDLIPPGMHATNTLDYLVLLEGEMLLKVDTGEVHFRAGDLIVDRGVLHGWRALGDAPALLVCVTIPAHPVGKGSTL